MSSPVVQCDVCEKPYCLDDPPDEARTLTLCIPDHKTRNVHLCSFGCTNAMLFAANLIIDHLEDQRRGTTP